MTRTEPRPWDGLHGWEQKSWSERLALAEYYVDASLDNEMCDAAWAQDLLRETLSQAHREGALVVRKDAPRPLSDPYLPRPTLGERLLKVFGRTPRSRRSETDRHEVALRAFLGVVVQHAPDGGTLHRKTGGCWFWPENSDNVSFETFKSVLPDIEEIRLEDLARVSANLSTTREVLTPDRTHEYLLDGVVGDQAIRMQWIPSSAGEPAMLVVTPVGAGGGA